MRWVNQSESESASQPLSASRPLRPLREATAVFWTNLPRASRNTRRSLSPPPGSARKTLRSVRKRLCVAWKTSRSGRKALVARPVARRTRPVTKSLRRASFPDCRRRRKESLISSLRRGYFGREARIDQRLLTSSPTITSGGLCQQPCRRSGLSPFGSGL